jgi:hypothetical protein
MPEFRQYFHDDEAYHDALTAHQWGECDGIGCIWCDAEGRIQDQIALPDEICEQRYSPDHVLGLGRGTQ